MKCKQAYFVEKIVNDPNTICVKSPIGNLCGRNIKVYFKKYRIGLGQYYKQGGESAVIRALISNPDFLSKNNGAASFLTVDIDNGLPNYTVEGKAYVVQDDGHYPLSKGQVYGLMEMIQDAMDIYDMDPENMILGRENLIFWSNEYRERSSNLETPSGSDAIDIYSDRLT